MPLGPAAADRRALVWILGAITLLAGALRAWVATHEPPHFDESFTAVQYVSRGLEAIATTYDEPNNHVLHSLLAHLSTGVFGDGPFALRLPALLAGIALLPALGLLAYAIVRGARPAPALAAAAVTAGFAAAAPPLIAYSANARGYSLALLLFTAQLGVTLALGRASSGRTRHWTARLWAAWILSGALALWTVPTAALGIGACAIWLVALRGRIRAALPVAGALLATGAAALLLYAPVLGQAGFGVDRFATAPLRSLATTTADAWTAGLALPLIGVAVALAFASLLPRPVLRGPNATLAVGVLVLPVAIVGLGRIPPYSRTYLFLLVLLAVLAGVGAARLTPAVLRSRARARAAVAALAAVALAGAVGAQTREAWGEDPPGPDHGQLVAALQASDPPVGLEGVPIVAPSFDAPQVRYAARRAGLDPTLVITSAPPGTSWVAFTRREVGAAEALAAVAAAPATTVTSDEVRGELRIIHAEG